MVLWPCDVETSGGCCLWPSVCEHTNPAAATAPGFCCKQSPASLSGILKENGRNSINFGEPGLVPLGSLFFGAQLDLPWTSWSFCVHLAVNGFFHLELTQHFSSQVHLEIFIIFWSLDLVYPFQVKPKTHLTPDPTSNRCLSFLHYVVAPGSVLNSVASKLKTWVPSHLVALPSRSHLGFYLKLPAMLMRRGTSTFMHMLQMLFFLNSTRWAVSP